MLASLVPLAVLVPFETAAPVADWTASIWALVAFVGTSSAIGYAMWLAALARMDAARVTAFLALSPITAALLSVLFLGARLGAADVAALALVAGALGVIASERTRPTLSALETQP